MAKNQPKPGDTGFEEPPLPLTVPAPVQPPEEKPKAKRYSPVMDALHAIDRKLATLSEREQWQVYQTLKARFEPPLGFPP